MAIKGKTKRSQGRTPRRITQGPRPAAVERRTPWYRAPAFGATVAIVALLVTFMVAVERVQFGWARDDVTRFTESLRAPMDELATVVESTSTEDPGFATIAEFGTNDEVRATDVVTRAQTWTQRLTGVRAQLEGLTIGEPGSGGGDGVPSHVVGGRVRELTAVRDAYLTGLGLYEEAAAAWLRAGEAVATAGETEGGDAEEGEADPTETLRDQNITAAQTMAQRGQEALDVAAGLLAELRARYDLPLDQRLPGESPSSFSGRYVSAVPTDSTPVLPPNTVPLAPEPTTATESTAVPEPDPDPTTEQGDTGEGAGDETAPEATTAPETTTG